jgi:glucan phosphoethanolaminetransferase (alkaline phosphatase superfamily)
MMGAASFLTVFFFQWCIVYCLRLFGSFYRKPVMRDYVYLMVVSLISSLVILINNSIFSLVFVFILITIFILQWLNIILLQAFRFKVNWPTIKIFFTGVGHFKDELQELWPTLLDDAKLLILPLWVILIDSALFYFSDHTLTYVFGAFLVYFIACVTKSRFDKRSIIFWLVAVVFVEALIYYSQLILLPKSSGFLWSYCAIIALLILMLVYALLIAKSKTAQFWQLPELLTAQFRDDKLSLAILTQAPVLKNSDLRLANLACQASQRTELFGLCRNANIILITMESLSNYYFNEQSPRSKIMPWFTSMQPHALTSQCHISPSSLTNNALHAIYAGGYREQTTYPHLQLSRQHGYHTSFLTSQKVHEFNMDKLLQQIGFTQIIDNVSVSKKRQQRINDPEFFAQAPKLLTNTLTQPVFLQVVNNQTHGPYFTYKEKYLDRKTRYLASITEADQTMEKFVRSLANEIDLSNTIIVYTADHGESFGEEGYTSHGNSIIQPQIEVPCLIYHPKLASQTINFSSHFDLMPTLLNLLGLDYTYEVLGASWGSTKRAEHCVVYSESRMGNTPSSFGIITPEQKIYFDRMLAQYEIRDLQDQVLQTLTGENYNYYLKLLVEALNNRGLIY